MVHSDTVYFNFFNMTVRPSSSTVTIVFSNISTNEIEFDITGNNQNTNLSFSNISNLILYEGDLVVSDTPTSVIVTNTTSTTRTLTLQLEVEEQFAFSSCQDIMDSFSTFTTFFGLVIIISMITLAFGIFMNRGIEGGENMTKNVLVVFVITVIIVSIISAVGWLVIQAICAP